LSIYSCIIQVRISTENQRQIEHCEPECSQNLLVAWNALRSTIKRTIRTRPFDILIVELPHRWRAHQAVERRRRQLAVMIVRAAQADDHVALRFVVADPLNEAAAVDAAAFECFEIDRTAVFYVNGFGMSFRS
jgi:hypothetical protein